MKIGYPCINNTVGCKSGRTFRLKSFTEKRFRATVENNLSCLSEILDFNVRNDILFFRITSDLIPFASHPVCKVNWQKEYRSTLNSVGDFIKKHKIRISMHPDQFILLNSLKKEVLERSLKELNYHVDVLDLMRLDSTAKIQIHVGGVYGDKQRSKERFIKRYRELSEAVTRRLVIENDDRSYHLQDCLEIYSRVGVPILFDVFHHEVNNDGTGIKEAFTFFHRTWRRIDGDPMVDYSTQAVNNKTGKHRESIDLHHFKSFLKKTVDYDFDVMLEIKDKEKSALRAVKALKSDPRFKRSLYDAYRL